MSPHHISLGGQDLTVAEFNRIPQLVSEGSISASMAILVSLAEAIDAGQVDLDNVLHGESLRSALDNAISWYADLHGEPVSETLVQAATTKLDPSSIEG